MAIAKMAYGTGREIWLGKKTTSWRTGLTLLELVIVLSIIAISAAIGIPNWISGKPWRELKAAARDVYGEFMKAKTRAVATSRAHRVFFDLEHGLMRLMEGEVGCLRASMCTTWTDVPGGEMRIPPSISIVGNPFGDNNASFNVDGTAEAGNVTLRNSKGQTYKVIVSSSGRIRMEKGS
jgi:prepilin-type N-terminal cleavage/methylation domain-containing protein